MSLAIFFDVDGVLTDEPINMQIARKLGVEKTLVDLENDFREGNLSNEEFNNEFIPLFNEAGFTHKNIEKQFNEISMRIGFEKLLRFDNIHLVSSGPSYFIDKLAKRYGIKEDNVLCSRYTFDSKGKLKACIAPVNSHIKAAYVQNQVRKYKMSIGVGDNSVHDTAFLCHCRVKVLMNDGLKTGFLCIKDIVVLEQLISILQDNVSM